MTVASELSRRLARDAEAVCRAYLPAGRRNGRYWITGDVKGTPGRSLFVKLSGDRSGQWMDAATGEHGDLLDLIRLNRSHTDFRDTLDEARQFIRDPVPVRASRCMRPVRPTRDTLAAAERLHALSRPVSGTLGEMYLRKRAITAELRWPSLRFHPACHYRAYRHAARESWPALLGVVTDLAGNLTGLQRTWLSRNGSAKAPLADQGAPWAIFSAMPCASASRLTSWPPARASIPCSSCFHSFQICPWRHVFPPRTWPRSRSRPVCAVSTSSVTMMPPGILLKSVLSSDAARRVSRRAF